MNMGAERAAAQPQGDTGWDRTDEPLPAAESFDFANLIEEEDAPASTGIRVFAGLLILLALAWTAACAYGLMTAWPGASLPAWTGWIATASAPLILLALAWHGARAPQL